MADDDWTRDFVDYDRGVQAPQDGHQGPLYDVGVNLLQDSEASFASEEALYDNNIKDTYLMVEPDEVIDAGMDNPMYFQGCSGAGDTEGYMAVSPDWLSEQWDLLSEQPWFRGFMSRQEAKDILHGKKPGTFCVRVSESQPGHYAISVVQPGNHFEHMLVLPSWAGKESNAPGNTRYRLGTYSKELFNTVPKLVAYYIAHPYIDKYRLVGEVLSERQAGGYMELASTTNT